MRRPAKRFRKAVEKSPTQINSYLHLADILRMRLNRKPDADKVMDEMVNP